MQRPGCVAPLPPREDLAAIGDAFAAKTTLAVRSADGARRVPVEMDLHTFEGRASGIDRHARQGVSTLEPQVDVQDLFTVREAFDLGGGGEESAPGGAEADLSRREGNALEM